MWKKVVFGIVGLIIISIFVWEMTILTIPFLIFKPQVPREKAIEIIGDDINDVISNITPNEGEKQIAVQFRDLPRMKVLLMKYRFKKYSEVEEFSWDFAGSRYSLLYIFFY